MYRLLTDDECALILSKSIKNCKISLVKFEIKQFSYDTLGYLGEHLLLQVLYKTTSDPEVHEVTYFVKAVPQEKKEEQEFVQSLGVIRKETDIYEKLINKIQPLVSHPFCAKFYYGRDDIIVFENLQAKGFKLPDEIYFDELKIKAVLRTMAMMHAGSLKFEELKRCTTSNSNYVLVSEGDETLMENKYDFVEGHVRNKWYKSASNCVARLSEYFTQEKGYTEKILNYLQYTMPKLDDISKTSRNVLCHDDLWRNNILFNHDNECLFVDFQLAKYGPPAFDFWTFLYFNAEHQFILQNLNTFIDFYYDTLDCELRKSSIEISSIIPKQEFSKTIEDYSMPTLFQVCVCCTYIFRSDEFTQRMAQDKQLYEDFNFGDRSKYILEEIQKNKYFEARLKNVILPLCKMF